MASLAFFPRQYQSSENGFGGFLVSWFFRGSVFLTMVCFEIVMKLFWKRRLSLKSSLLGFSVLYFLMSSFLPTNLLRAGIRIKPKLNFSVSLQNDE